MVLTSSPLAAIPSNLKKDEPFLGQPIGALLAEQPGFHRYRQRSGKVERRLDIGSTCLWITARRIGQFVMGQQGSPIDALASFERD
jgi:hypothetical protein